MTARETKRVCLGAFAGAHGVKGEVKVKSFTGKPEAVAAYGPVETEDGERRFTLALIRVLTGGLVLARAPEINNREDAAELKGMRLYVGRERLPPPGDDEFYIEDLVGLSAFDEAGASLGAVAAVYNFGAGDIIELKDIPELKGMQLVAFTKANIPAVDVAAGKITVRRDAIQLDETADAEADGACIDNTAPKKST